MRSEFEHIETMDRIAGKIRDRIEDLARKRRTGVSVAGELESIEDLARGLYAGAREFAMLFGIGGPKPIGLLNVREDPTVPKGEAHVVQDGKVVARITNLGDG